MSRIAMPPGRGTRLATYLQPIAFAASWLALVALATGCFFRAQRGPSAQPTLDDVSASACSTAIAGATAAIAALRDWRSEAVDPFSSLFSVLLVGAIAALLLVYLLWLDYDLRSPADGPLVAPAGFSMSRRRWGSSSPDTTGRWGLRWASRSARQPGY